MQISIRKNITSRRKTSFQGLLNVLILIIAVPVIIIAAVSILVYLIFIFFRSSIVKNKGADQVPVHYHFEKLLIENENLRIVLVEDELDVELTSLNESWMDVVNPEETYLYRARTIPVIPGLEGKICCFYYKEQHGGILLQLAGTSEVLTSELLFLAYPNLDVSLVDEIGAFYLYNDDKNDKLIKGFNRTENMTLEIDQPSNISENTIILV